MHAAEGAALLHVMLVLLQHARGLGARSWRNTQRGYLRDMQPAGHEYVYIPQSRGLALSSQRTALNARHQQRPSRRAHNNIQLTTLVACVVLRHASVVRVVRHPARHPGTQRATPQVLLARRPHEATTHGFRWWRSSSG